MKTRIARWVGLCGLLLSLSGCGWFGSKNSDSNSDEAIPELGERAKPSTNREAANKTLATENLELRLQVGDRFPLIKTVEQRLRQQSPDGGPPIVSSSKLVMTLAIIVEDIDQGAKTLGVRYQRVRYEHDIAGEKVSYDSAALFEGSSRRGPGLSRVARQRIFVQTRSRQSHRAGAGLRVVPETLRAAHSRESAKGIAHATGCVAGGRRDRELCR